MAAKETETHRWEQEVGKEKRHTKWCATKTKVRQEKTHAMQWTSKCKVEAREKRQDRSIQSVRRKCGRLIRNVSDSWCDRCSKIQSAHPLTPGSLHANHDQASLPARSQNHTTWQAALVRAHFQIPSKAGQSNRRFFRHHFFHQMRHVICHQPPSCGRFYCPESSVQGNGESRLKSTSDFVILVHTPLQHLAKACSVLIHKSQG